MKEITKIAGFRDMDAYEIIEMCHKWMDFQVAEHFTEMTIEEIFKLWHKCVYEEGVDLIEDMEAV